MLATLGLMMCLAIFGIATGIGLILLRNWARISALIWGGLCVFFGAIGIPIVFFIPLVPPESVPNLSADSMQAVRWILLFFYGLPLIAGIWWLILFNRKTVKAQFAATTTSAASGQTQKSRCPLPVAVLAWFYITSILNLLFLPFLPLPCSDVCLWPSVEAQAVELLSDAGAASFLACEWRRERAQPKLQRRDGVFPERHAEFAPSP